MEAHIYRNGSNECSSDWVEGIDLARHKAEVSNEQIAPKYAKTRRRERDAPW